MSQRETMRPLLLKAEDAAAYLGISYRHFRTLHSAGKLPAPVRLGNAVRWNRDELERWVSAGVPARDAWETMRN